MLKSLIGSEARIRILLYLSQNKKAYLTEMEAKLEIPLFAVQTQLKNLESEGVVKTWQEGKRKFYGFDAEYPLLKELLALLRKAHSHIGFGLKLKKKSAKAAKARRR